MSSTRPPGHAATRHEPARGLRHRLPADVGRPEPRSTSWCLSTMRSSARAQVERLWPPSRSGRPVREETLHAATGHNGEHSLTMKIGGTNRIFYPLLMNSAGPTRHHRRLSRGTGRSPRERDFRSLSIRLCSVPKVASAEEEVYVRVISLMIWPESANLLLADSGSESQVRDDPGRKRSIT